jgi:predicted RNA binding protein YcfA (HicA-like mRNA interferase family)
MTRKQKLFDTFFANPCDCSLSEIESILTAYDCARISAKGSHVKWKHILLSHDLIIPVHNNNCKDFYKKAALKFIKEIAKHN